jgi:hypothetical protein
MLFEVVSKLQKKRLLVNNTNRAWHGGNEGEQLVCGLCAHTAMPLW